MAQLHLHLIINKQAGGGKAAESAELIITELTKKKISFDIYSTEYQGHAFDLTKKLKQECLMTWPLENSKAPFPLLVVLGGDGTLHEVINALDQELMIPVAYLPSGSGNDFARGVNLSRDPLKALEQLLRIQEPQFFHFLQFQEAIQEETGYAVNNIGIGIDAAIVAHANHSLSKKKLNKFNIGSLTYLMAALKLLAKQKGFPIMVEANGQKFPFDKAFLCTTTNHPFFGGGIAIAPHADPKKKELELIVVERIHLIKIIYLIIQLLRRRHLSSPHVHQIKSKQIRIVSTTSQHGQADGEELGSRPFDLAITTQERLFWL